MLIAVWSPKGGSGTSVVAASLSLALSRRGKARIADLAGDQPAIFAVPRDPLDGLTGWLSRGATAPGELVEACSVVVAPGLDLLPAGLPGSLSPDLAPEAGAALATVLREQAIPTVVDAGLADQPALRAVVDVADASLVVLRACYLALRRGVVRDLVRTAAGIVLIEEPARACGPREVSEILDRPVLARIPLRPAIARAVDAGTLAVRLPSTLLAATSSVLDSVIGPEGRAA